MKIYGHGEFHGQVVVQVRHDDMVFAVTRRPKGSHIPDHAHSCHSFITLINGEHFYTGSEGQIRWSIPGAWYYNSPNDPHTHDACPTDILSAGIHIPATGLDQSNIPPKASWSGNAAQRLSDMFVEELIQAAPPQPEVLTSIYIILKTNFQRLKTIESPDQPAWLIKVKDQLDQSPLQITSVTDLAQTHAVDPSHLSRTFRKAYGQTISDYLRDRRLEWTYQQVTTTQNKLGEIAQSAGFTDHAHLCRVFKKRYGKTPSFYRT